MQPAFDFYVPSPRRPERPERLFFALLPGRALFAIEQFARRFVLECQWLDALLSADRWHVSLQHVGDYRRLREKFIFGARKAAESVAMPPFDVTFQSIETFEGAPSRNGKPRRRPLVLIGEGAALRELHGMLGAAMEKNGFRAGTDFTPHMTLSYGSESVPPQEIEPVRFAAKELVLIHSRLWLSQYEILGRWPFRRVNK
jgi:2'-5' RNA ligase